MGPPGPADYFEAMECRCRIIVSGKTTPTNVESRASMLRLLGRRKGEAAASSSMVTATTRSPTAGTTPKNHTRYGWGSIFTVGSQPAIGKIDNRLMRLERCHLSFPPLGRPIRTEGLADVGADYLRTMERAIPLGRLGTPEDTGNAAAYITGRTIVVDGGQTLPASIEAMQ